MTHALVRTAVVLTFAAMAWFAVGSDQPVSTDRGERIATAKVVGSNSCAAASCHGGDGRKGAVGSEHTTWADYDPHHNAYRVLFQERSVRMVKLLAADSDAEPVAAHRNRQCLACHGVAPPNAAPVPPESEAHRTGVSCENCHGAAEKWLTVHYQRGWAALDPERKAADYGLLQTKNLAYRTQLCGGCHIGEPGREVDHRLIAAGHPALRFEFAAYQAEPLYTKHWREKGYGPDVEAWTWVIGQVGAARSAAELLRHRADETGRDWPELAEYTCFSCHQDLAPNARSAARAAPPRPGRLPWGSWHYPLVLDLARSDGVQWAGSRGSTDGLQRLADLFRQSDRPRPTEARAAATAAVADLDRWLADLQARAGQRVPLRATELRAALAHTARFAADVPETGAASTDWDRSTQGYLAVAALYRALVAVDPRARSARTEETLKALAAGLRFPPGRDGPARWTPNQERDYRSQWKELRTRLTSAE